MNGSVHEATDPAKNNALAQRLKQLAAEASFALKKSITELSGIFRPCRVV